MQRTLGSWLNSKFCGRLFFSSQILRQAFLLEQDLINGQDTSIPVFDFQDKRRVGSRVIKSTSFEVVSMPIIPFLQYSPTGILTFSFIVGYSWWYLCSACKTTIFARYSSRSGKFSFFPFLLFESLVLVQIGLVYVSSKKHSIYKLSMLYVCEIRLVGFILVFFLKFSTILESLVPWTT